MFLNHVSHYLPAGEVPNAFFNELHGFEEGWIQERTGIEKRRVCLEGENTNTLALDAVEKGIGQLSYELSEVDVIIGATYSPYDTVGTLGHAIQSKYELSGIPVVSISSACSSLLNAIEIAEGYMAMGKATKALVVAAEHNTAYHNTNDKKAGHLWGDGAVAFFLSKERIRESDAKILTVMTAGGGDIGKGMLGVYLRPNEGGIVMPDGRDVFINACTYMEKVTRDILTINNLVPQQLKYFIPHQANHRISVNVQQRLELTDQQVVSNIQEFGNTGCAGCGIGFSQVWPNMSKDDLACLTVFGGGYSYGSMLIQK